MAVGGLAGISEGTIVRSSVGGSVGNSSVSGSAVVGGLVGGESGLIVDSQSSATVTGGSAFVSKTGGGRMPAGNTMSRNEPL